MICKENRRTLIKTHIRGGSRGGSWRPPPPPPMSRSGSAAAYMKVVHLFKFTIKARAIIKVTQPSYTPFSNQIAFERLLSTNYLWNEFFILRRVMITLLRKLRWIVQGCHCWQTRVKLVVVFNNFTLIMTIFGPTSYLRKHRANRCVLWHFRVFPVPLWCTSATEQNW